MRQALDHLLSALHECRDRNWQMSEGIPRHWDSIPVQEGYVQSDPLELATVQMPPETFTEEQLAENIGEGRIGGFPLFPEDVSLRCDVTTA